MKRARKGFTLVEVTVVLVIIAIIAAIAVPNISGYIDKSKRNNCQSVMNSFISDIENKVVSKRYFDLSELNSALTEVVKNYGDIKKSDGSESLDSVTNGTEFLVSGACPNGGNYRFRWTITPVESENEWTVKSADVQLGINVDSETGICECDCMNSEEHVTKNTHKFTAALVSTEYKESRQPEEIARDDIQKIISKIESPETNKADIAALVQNFSDDKYTINGITLNSAGDKVEWICVYQRDVRENDNVLFYSVTRNSYTLSDQPSVQINEERKVFSIPASDILDESGKLKDLSKLPPAEGSAGSTVYKEGWNVPYTVAGADSSTGKANKIPVAYMNNSEVEDLGWIQKTGNWYVQKNDSVYGIDIPEDSEKVLVDTLSNGEASLDYAESAEGNPDNQMKLEASESASLSDLKNAFKVNIVYQNGKSQTFSHLEKIETDNGYYIKNGYIIVDPDANVKSYNWTGVFGAPAAEGEISDDARKNLSDLDSLLAEEENIIRRFENGEYGDGDSINAKVAYQEYYKYLDESDGKYKYRPVTVFKIITLTKDAVPDENTPPELSVNPLNNKIENTVKLPVEVTGSPNNILLTTKQEVTYTRPSGGSGSLMVGGKEEGTISVSDVADSYNIVYKQTGDSEKFSLNDLVITKKVKYDVTQKVTLEDGNVKDVSVGSFTEDITLKPAVSADQSNGYYLSGDSNLDGGQTPASKTSESVSLLNNGGTEKRIYLTGFNDGSISIGTVSTQNSVQNSLKWSYTPGKDDNEFLFKRIKVSIDYPVSVTTSFSGYPSVGTASSSSEGTVKVTLGHRTAEGGDGYYLEGVTEEEKKLLESDLYNRLKAYESSAVVKLYKANEGQCNNISLFNVNTSLEYITANYANDKTTSYSDSKLSANAGYLINVENCKDETETKFSKTISISRTATDNRRCYLSQDGLQLTSDTVENRVSQYNKVKNNETSFMRDNLNWNVIDTIVNFWGGNQKKFNDDAWVVYSDGNGSNAKETKVRINLANGYVANEFIYYTYDDSNSDHVYIAGYRGDSRELEIPETVTGGIWKKGTSSAKNALNFEINGEKIYYLADDSTYKVTRIGGVYNDSDESNKNQYKMILPGGDYKLNGLSVPSSVNSIGAYALAGQKNLINVNLPETGLTTIEQGAFEDAAVSGLEFKIPSSVTTIGTNAFKNFSLPNGELKINGVSDSAAMSIEKDIFTESKFKKLSFGGSVKKIGQRAFSGNLSSASLNLGSVTQIDDFAFMGCVNMKGGLEIPLGVDSVGFQAFDSYAVSTTGTDTGKLVLYSGSSNSGKNLGGLIFTNAKFSGITIPASSKIENISKYAFRNSPYKNKMPYKNIKGPLEILGSVKLIDNSAFEDCTGLTGELSIPESTLTIGDAAFLGCCNLSKLSFAENSELTSIGSRAFMECQSFSGRLELEKTKIKSIGMQAFRNCKNFSGNLIIPQTVTGENGQLGIGYCAFENFASRASFDENASNKAGQLILKAGTCSMGKEVGPFTFTGSHFDGVVIGGSDSIVERVGAYAFKNPDSGELSLYPDDSINHNGVDHSTTHNTDNNPVDENRNTETEDEYFNQTESQISQTLTVDYSGIHGDLSVENGVTEIGESAFENCTGLTGSLNLKYTEKIGTKAFSECLGFNGNLTLSPALDTLGDSAFENCKNITGSLVIPHTLSVIGNSAFSGCSGFNGTLTLANKRDDDGVSLKGVTSIKSSAFKNCTGFKGGVTVPESVGYIGDSAFRNFAAAVLPADAGELRILGSSYTDENTGVRGIGGMIFTGGRYNNIYIGGKVTKINAQAFDTTTERNGGIDYSTPSTDSDYSKVSGYLEIADTVTHIGNKAFCGVKFDRYVTLGTGLQEIGAHAFDHCTDVSYDNNHKGLTIHNKVTSIGVQAFNSFGSAEHPGELTILGYSDTDGDAHIIGFKNPGLERTIFNQANFRNITIGGNGASVNTVGYRFMKSEDVLGLVFDYSGIKGSLTIGSGIREIMGEAFNYTGIDDHVYLEDADDLKEIGVSAFEGLYKARGNLTIPEHVTKMGVRAFKSFARDTAISNNEELGKLMIYGYSEDDADHTLGYRLFSQAHFNGVSIGGEVKTIGKFAFYNSGFNTDIVNEEEQINTNNTSEPVNDNNDNPYIGYLLNNKSSDYTGLKGTVTIGPDVETIDDFAFGNCGNLTGLVFAEKKAADGQPELSEENKTSIGTIGYASFIRCKSMRNNLVIPQSVSSIGRCAFKQYAQAITEESEMSELIILGSSMERKINGETKYILGNIDKREDQDPDPIFPSANFKNIYIGGKIDIIACSFMNNKQHLKSQYTDIKDTSGTFDYTGLHGNLTIGPSVEEIKAEAFYGCENLKGRLIFKEDADGNTRLNTIGNNAFNSCVNFGGGLTIPESVEKIGIGAFKYMSQGMEGYKPVLGELKILGYSSSKTIDKVTYNTIDARIFDHAHFRNITIGGKVQYVEEAFMCNFNDYPYAAEGKAQYVDIYEDENGNKYTPVTRYNGVYGDVKLGKTVQIVGKNAFWDCHNLNGQLKFNDDSVPVGEGIEAAGIQKIGENAFSGCTAFSYPNTSGVISIVDKYFTGFTVDYDGLVIPSSVKEIGSFAFKGFGSGYGASAGHLWLHSGSANNGKTIEPLVFTGSKFNGIYIGGNITKIEDKAFYSNPGGESFSYKDKSLTTDDANYNNWTGDILILGYENASGNGVRVIGEKAFFNHQNMNGLLWLNNGIETIGENAFNRFYKAQRNLVIPPSVKEIGNCAFKGYAQQTPEANRGRLEIYGGSCDNGKTLGTVDSNGGITPIFPYSRFNSVCIGGNIARISANAFAQGSPERNRETNNTYEYSGLTGDLIFSGSVTEIGANAFKGCTGFSKRLVFNGNFMANNGYDDISGNADGAKLREIGAYAFSGCTNFYSDYVTEDGSQAVFTVPDSVRTIGEHAFSSMCSGIPDTSYSRVPKLNLLGVSHDIDSAFGSSGNKNSQDKYPTIQIFDNAKFNNVYIGGSVKVIAENAFDNSSGVYSKIRGDIELNVEKIWAKAFYMMHTGDMGTNRKKLILDSGLTTLGDQAFGNSQFFGDCPANERVLDIPSSLTTIYGDPFNKFCPNYYNKTIINKKSNQDIGKADGAGITIVNN